MSYWDERRVTVCGGKGFLGRYVHSALLRLGAMVRSVDRFSHDLSKVDEAREAIRSSDVVINLAAHVGGIKYASDNHAAMFLDNIALSNSVLEACRLENIPRSVVVSSACVYPAGTPIPMKESFGHIGEPIDSSVGYGYAKRVAEMQAIMYAQKYGMSIAIARPFNAYGPGDTSGHVIPDLLRKLFASKPGEKLKIWGDGWQRRSFTYAIDWADALLFIAEHGPSGYPVNLAATDIGITITELALVLMDLTGIKRTIEGNVGPVGHADRIPDTSWLKGHGWKPKVEFPDGLRWTVDDWQAKEALLNPGAYA